MAHFAPVCPPAVLEGLVNLKLAGPYHLWLAHDVLDKKDQYIELEYAIRQQYPERYIIMDNSLIELGKPLPAGDLLFAYNLVKANSLVLPDQLLDREWTIQHSREAAKELRNKQWDVSLAAVIQGKDDMDIARCCVDQTAVNPASVLVPRILVKAVGTRGRAIQECYKTMFSRPIHLLGFSDDLMDDMSCARMPQVMGIDSTEPLRLGMDARTISLDTKEIPPPRGNFWDVTWDGLTPIQRTFIGNNLWNVRRWINVT